MGFVIRKQSLWNKVHFCFSFSFILKVWPCLFNAFILAYLSVRPGCSSTNYFHHRCSIFILHLETQNAVFQKCYGNWNVHTNSVTLHQALGSNPAQQDKTSVITSFSQRWLIMEVRERDYNSSLLIRIPLQLQMGSPFVFVNLPFVQQCEQKKANAASAKAAKPPYPHFTSTRQNVSFKFKSRIRQLPATTIRLWRW